MSEEKRIMNQIDIISKDIEDWEKEIRHRKSWIKGAKELIHQEKKELNALATKSVEERK